MNAENRQLAYLLGEDVGVTLYRGDCLEEMKRIPDGSVDLVCTSPPYDNLRTYGQDNLRWDETVWKGVFDEIYRVVTEGGVCVWVVGDATIKGSETGTSFKQALYAKEIGFKLHDTMIWDKGKCASVGGVNRYESVWEFMFVFAKGTPTKVNLIKDKPNKRAGETQTGAIRQKDGSTRRTTGYGKRSVAPKGRRHNVWHVFPVMSSKDRLHPAPFPVQIARDHIITWSDEGDTVLDPFMGSGTTGVAAMNLNRRFIGIELNEEYFEIAQERIFSA
jgi:site-specific DNA-methyltransferase (adenine-specific)